MVTVTTNYDGQTTVESFSEGENWINENGTLRVFGKDKVLAEFAPGSWARVYYGN